MRFYLSRYLSFGLLAAIAGCVAGTAEPSGQPQESAVVRATDGSAEAARALVDLFEKMTVSRLPVVRQGGEFVTHQQALRQQLLEGIGLWPLPVRLGLDVRMTEPLDHPWCTVRRVYYQLWPGVYASGLLYQPKAFTEKPAPAMLCPHGHWAKGNADPVVQARCLMFARQGYVTFSPTQNHYEELNIGVSHQTVGVWANMRALDFLESLPEVDGKRIGVCGESGGGLQTEMLVALDARVKAATIVGLTCDFREILFPYQAHCACNHFPGVLQFTDHPEISALGLPVPVLYLTMNDWTRNFARDSFPAIQALYAANGYADRVRCVYEPTEHTYDRSKRELTYAWMHRWLPGPRNQTAAAEQDKIQFLPTESLQSLRIQGMRDDDFTGVGRFYRKHYQYKPVATDGSGEDATPAKTSTSWNSYCRSQREALRHLLGLDHALPPETNRVEQLDTRNEEGLIIERSFIPSEATIRIPCLIVRASDHPGRLPITILCSPAGKDALMKNRQKGSPSDLARRGFLVALPDVRFTGRLALEAIASDIGPSLMIHHPAYQLGKSTDKNSAIAGMQTAWERNAIVWGRPLTGMTVTDLRAILDALAARPDTDFTQVTVSTFDSAAVGLAILFAGALDPRITAIEIDLQGRSFAANTLPVVPFILRHGDVPQWLALLADHQVTIHHFPGEPSTITWLTGVFTSQHNRNGLRLMD